MKLAIAFVLAALCVFAADGQEWFPFNPADDSFSESAIDLRALNEKAAGEHGFIAAKGDQFVFSKSGTKSN